MDEMEFADREADRKQTIKLALIICATVLLFLAGITTLSIVEIGLCRL